MGPSEGLESADSGISWTLRIWGRGGKASLRRDLEGYCLLGSLSAAGPVLFRSHTAM